MAAQDIPHVKDALIILGATALVVPIFHRWKWSPLLGFMAIGVTVGPFGLGALTDQLPWLSAITISNRAQIGGVAELGITLLLFMIGLELTFERLRAMRRYVFGLGLAHFALSAVALGGVAIALGLVPLAAAVVGCALALSSTAIVIQVLADQKKITAPVGRVSFAVLLFQDLAVVPLLVIVGILGARAVSTTADGSILMELVIALVPAAAVIITILAGGRLLLRPLFRLAAAPQRPELFVAACLLVILSAGAATAWAGYSMALGAFVAGLLLAETEYRREVEVVIEPFKGLLLGVFLVSIGMSLDLQLLAADFGRFAAAAVVLIAIKAALFVGIARLFHVGYRPAIKAALMLGPAGEFAFVLIGAALAGGLLTAEVGSFVLVLATLTMALIPVLGRLADWAAARLAASGDAALPASFTELPHHDAPHMIIAGYGRVGQLVAEMMTAQNIPYVAVDLDVAAIAAHRKQGQPVYYGNAARAAFLQRCGITTARGLVITMDSPDAVDEVAAAARAERADLPIIARARDARHAQALYALGVTDAVPETVEASLQLGESALIEIGVPMGLVIAAVHEKRADYRQKLQAAGPPRAIGRRRETLRKARPLTAAIGLSDIPSSDTDDRSTHAESGDAPRRDD